MGTRGLAQFESAVSAVTRVGAAGWAQFERACTMFRHGITWSWSTMAFMYHELRRPLRVELQQVGSLDAQSRRQPPGSLALLLHLRNANRRAAPPMGVR